jgi:hypothetical protein
MRLLSCRPSVLLALAGCLGPQVSDVVSQPQLVLPAGAAVPLIDTTDDGKAIVANDGVDGTIPLLSGFVNGRPVHFWNFGPVPTHASPLFRLVRVSGGTTTRLPHPPIFTSIPGDIGYSPYWTVFEVPVTDAYQGQLITSPAALNEAQNLGLVGAAKPHPTNIDCPVVARDIRLEVGGGQPPLAPPSVYYYAGYQGVYYDFGETALASDNVTVPTTDLYELRRQGGDVLSEPVRGVDLDGDGDKNDTNDIFAAAFGDPAWSPRCRIVDVTVPADTSSIDTSGDETMADFKSASQLFGPDGTPIAGKALSVDPTNQVFNCLQQSTAGAM